MKYFVLLLILIGINFEWSSVTADSVTSFVAASTNITEELLALYPLNRFTAAHDITGQQVDGPSAGFSYATGPSGFDNGAVYSTSIVQWANYAFLNFNYSAAPADTNRTLSVWLQLRNTTDNEIKIIVTPSQLKFSVKINRRSFDLIDATLPAFCDLTSGVYLSATYEVGILGGYNPVNIYCNGQLLVGPFNFTLALEQLHQQGIKPQSAVQFSFIPFSVFDASLACLATYGAAVTGPESMRILEACNTLNSDLCNGCDEGTCQSSFNGQMPLYNCSSLSGIVSAGNSSSSSGGATSVTGGNPSPKRRAIRPKIPSAFWVAAMDMLEKLSKELAMPINKQ